MPKMTKTQARRALDAIKSKAFKLMGAVGPYPEVLSVADYSAINKIVKKAHNRLK